MPLTEGQWDLGFSQLSQPTEEYAVAWLLIQMSLAHLSLRRWLSACEKMTSATAADGIFVLSRQQEQPLMQDCPWFPGYPSDGNEPEKMKCQINYQLLKEKKYENEEIPQQIYDSTGRFHTL